LVRLYALEATYVNGTYSGPQAGTCAQPYANVPQGFANVPDGHSLIIAGGTYSLSSAPLTIDRSMRVVASGGVVRIQSQ
jgi:hypothetical protein